MTTVDTCVIIAFLEGDSGPDVEAFEQLLRSEEAVVAPSTITELLSDPRGGAQASDLVGGLNRLPLDNGYWERAGALRARLRGAGRKAALGDALIAQACLDSDVPLLTRDSDFAAFAEIARLKLAAIAPGHRPDLKK